jgi:hypothetical protein
MKMSAAVISTRTLGLSLAIALLMACGGPPPATSSVPGQGGAPAPVGDTDVVVKGAFDPDDGAGAMPAPLTGAEAEAARRGYSPYTGRSYPTRVYFGDTHNHTANSGDAFMAGDRLTPEQAYRFARGEEVV